MGDKEDPDVVAAIIDIPNESGFVSYFKSLPKCARNETIRMFNRGEYYTIHGENAEMIADRFLNTSQAVRQIGTGDSRLPSVSINSARFEPLIRFLLVENSFRLEIYRKPGGKAGAENSWKLEIRASPGCLGELEELLYNTSNNNTIAINQNVAALLPSDDNRSVHFALIDVIECTIHIGSFGDDSSFTLLESLLVRHNPKECLLPAGIAKDRIKMMLRKNAILASDYDDSQTNENRSKKCLTETEAMLGKLLKPEYMPRLEPILADSRLPLIPLRALLDYLALLSDQYCYSNYHLKAIEPDAFVRLDLASITNLHLFPRDRSRKEAHSLFQVLNHCRSILGRNLLDAFIRNPLTDLARIEQRLDCVEFFRDNSLITASFFEHFLPKIPDITKIYKKLTNGRCKLRDLLQVYLVVEQLPLMLNAFNEDETLPKSVIAAIVEPLRDSAKRLKPFRDLANESIDFERYNDTRELCMSASVSEELAAVKAEIDKLHQRANKEFETVRGDLYRNHDVEKTAIKLELDKNGFYFRVTKQYAPTISRHKRYKEMRSSAKESRFLSSPLDELNDDFVRHSTQYNELQQEYIEKFIEQTRQYMETIARLEQTLAFTDVMIAFAKASQQPLQHYVRPTILPIGSGKIFLKQFRHPIIELMKEMNFVANDIHFEESSGHKFFVVTGPNMGGKSTLIRSVALCVLMSQIGCFVPCDEAQISIVDAIYTRISASDDPTLGLSTFMSEMVEAAAILRAASKNSLIVIDELGRSTGTFDGFGIAQAITEHLANQICAYTLFATHFHHLALGLPRVGRLAMQSMFADRDKGGDFVNHYRATSGTAANSFGIELAKRAMMPERIVDRAAEKLEQMQKSLGDSAQYDKVIDTVMRRLKRNDGEDEEMIEANNDDRTYRSYLCNEIRQHLMQIDWNNFFSEAK